MKMWGYYAWHTFINNIRKFFRSQIVATIFAVLLLIGLFGATIGIVSSVLSKADGTGEAIESEAGTVADEAGDTDIDPEDTNNPDEITEEDIVLVKIWVEAGLELLLLVFVLVGMYTGSKNGSDIFLMPDVNILFTAPIKPQSVLMFRMSFQMAAALFGSVYLLFQIPNMMLNLHLSGYVVVIVFLAWILLIILQKLISVWAYTLAASHPALQKFVLPAILAIVAVFAAITGLTYLATGRDVLGTVQLLYTSEWSRWLPIIGWFKAMVMTAINGQLLLSLLYLLLLLLGMAAMVWGIWQIKADFYEDAITGAQARDELAHAAESSNQGTPVVQTDKKRSEKIKRNTGMKGSGASVFLRKELYNRKRFCMLGLFTRTMLVYLAISALLSFFSWKASGTADFQIVGLSIAGILFFRNYGNPIAAESSLNWLFLVPDDAYKKVFFAMMAGSAACAMDLAPALVLAAIWAQLSPLVLLLWFVTLLGMDFMLSAIGLLLEALFPSSAMDMIKGFLQLILKFVALFFIAIALLIGYLIGGIAAGLVCTLGLCVVLGAIGFIAYPTMLHNGIG